MKDSSEIVHFILNLVSGVKPTGDGYTFLCPAHEDKRASAFVKADKNGNAILRCFAGCSRRAICEAMGISETDLYVKKRSTTSSKELIATYKYFNESGTLLYEKQRYLSPDGTKTFLYLRSDGAGCHLWSLNAGWFDLQGRNWKKIDKANNQNQKPKENARWFEAAPRVLYKLPQVRIAQPGSLILLCEGEKDADNAEQFGFVTTTAGSSTDWRKEFADALQGFNVVILPDNDDAGRKFAKRAARDLFSKATSIRIVELPGLKKNGDLTDWIKASGTKEKLLAQIRETKDYEPQTDDSLNADCEIDVSNLEEIADDDPPVSDDPKREAYLRQLARNAAKVMECYAILLRLLGFEKNHSRLLNALTAIGGARLNSFLASQKRIRTYYTENSEASSKDTVRRDIKKLLAEQNSLGVSIIRYIPGWKDFLTGKASVSKFQNYLLRYALSAINLSLDMPDTDPQSGRSLKRKEKLESACEQVIAGINRFVPIPAKPKAKGKTKTLEQIEDRRFSIDSELIQLLSSEGVPLKEAEAEFERLHEATLRRLKQCFAEQDKSHAKGSNHATLSSTEGGRNWEVITIS